MSDEKTGPISPVTVTMISGTGDGGAPLTTGTVGSTPDHQPNIVINVITPLMAIAVRFISQFLTSALGFLTLAMMPAGQNEVMKAIHAVDFGTLLVTAAGLSLAPAGYDLLKNLVTIFGKLENKYPIATGTV